MSCTIVWNSLNFSEWDQRFSLLLRPTLTQTYDYALAICPIYGQKPRWGQIFIDNHEVGLVQIQEASLFGHGLHAVILDRGPVWFEGCFSPHNFEAFVQAFAREFPKRFGRRRRFIPEIEATPDAQRILSKNGFKQSNISPYQTIWLDIRPDYEGLRSILKKKWRNALSKAERSPLEIKFDDTGADLDWLMAHYQADKKARDYPGPDPKIIRALAGRFGSKNNMIIGKACLEGEDIAGILVLCHAPSATYQIGWTSEAGRGHNAHHLLLWQMVEQLKARGMEYFDLGGIHDEAPGLVTFKEGMGGERFTGPGLFT